MTLPSLQAIDDIVESLSVTAGFSLGEIEAVQEQEETDMYDTGLIGLVAMPKKVIKTQELVAEMVKGVSGCKSQIQLHAEWFSMSFTSAVRVVWHELCHGGPVKVLSRLLVRMCTSSCDALMAVAITWRAYSMTLTACSAGNPH